MCDDCAAARHAIKGPRRRGHVLGLLAGIALAVIVGNVGSRIIESDAYRIHLDLTTITINDKPAAQFAETLDTQRYPSATCTLTQPITLPSEVTTGATVTAPATARLTLHGVTRPVTFTVTGRRNGSALQATGSIPITFSDWAIKPQSYGPIGSLADHGVAEFLLVLHRQ